MSESHIPDSYILDPILAEKNEEREKKKKADFSQRALTKPLIASELA